MYISRPGLWAIISDLASFLLRSKLETVSFRSLKVGVPYNISVWDHLEHRKLDSKKMSNNSRVSPVGIVRLNPIMVVSLSISVAFSHIVLDTQI